MASTTTMTVPATTTTIVSDEFAGLDFIVEFATLFVEPGGDEYTFVEVRDNSGSFSVEVPEPWSDVDGSPWPDGIVGPGIEMSVNAAEDLDAFYSGFTAPGILIGAATGFASDVGTVDPIEEWDFSQNCTNQGVIAYRNAGTDSDGFFTMWSDCGDSGAAMLITAATEPGGEYAMVAVGIALTQADVDAYANALATATVGDPADVVDAEGLVEIAGEFAGPADSIPDYLFESVEDDTGTIVVSVPVSWADRDTEPPGAGGASIAAAPDLNEFNDDWAAPGVWVARFEDASALLQEGGDFDYNDFCTYEGRYRYADVTQTGQFDVWSACGGTDTVLLVLETYRPNEDTPNLVLFQLPSEAELPVLEQAIKSFGVSR